MSRSTRGHHLTNLLVLEHPVLHTKFQVHWPFGSGEEGFFKVFTIYGNGGHLGYVTWIVWTNFRPPILKSSIWNLTFIGQAVSEEKIFKECGRQTDDRQSSPMRLWWQHSQYKRTHRWQHGLCTRKTYDSTVSLQQHSDDSTISIQQQTDDSSVNLHTATYWWQHNIYTITYRWQHSLYTTTHRWQHILYTTIHR